jgi:RNA polymerase sigma-70 factor, ECF subfamily
MDEAHIADAELLAGALAGDERAFTALYQRRQAAVFRFALQMSGSRPAAEDITQEVFLTLLREGSRYDAGRGSVAAYLYGIARNKVLRWLERDRPTEPAPSEISDPAAGTMDNLLRDESVQLLRAAILELPPHYRETVVLCDLHEASYEEAAAILRCAVGTVRSRLHRGRALLAERLKLGTEAAPARSWV